MPGCHLVFIEPPSMEVLRARLEGRGTESEDVIDARMKVAEVELSQKMKYDIALVNDDLEKATDELVAYIENQAMKN
jgi:guanylate kinase